MKTNPLPKLLILPGIALCLCTNGLATVTEIGPFVGNISETWESFPNYFNQPGSNLPSGTAIMGGAATITSPDSMRVFEPSAGPFFGGSTVSSAQPSDGTKGLGVDAFGAKATITFLNPTNAFGAYWGSVIFSEDRVISLDFSDGATASFIFPAWVDGTPQGILAWHGWSSTNPISSVTFSGDEVAIDGIQAGLAPSSAPVPDTASTAMLLTSALFGMLFFRSRNQPRSSITRP